MSKKEKAQPQALSKQGVAASDKGDVSEPIIAHPKSPVKLKQRESSARWAKANPGKIIEASRRYRKNHPEKARQACLRWYRENEHKRRAYLENNYKKVWCWGSFHSHRGRKKILLLTPAELLGLAEKSFSCFYCGVILEYRRFIGHKPNTATLDIIDPREPLKSGNLRIVCDSCNKTKSNRSHGAFVSYCSDITRAFKEIQ